MKVPPMAVLSVQGYHGHFACRDFAGGGSFRARYNLGITRRGLDRREFRSTIDRDASLKFRHNKARLEISGEQA